MKRKEEVAVSRSSKDISKGTAEKILKQAGLK